MPRAGNASGGGQPGWIVKCKGWETDPNAYTYVITQAAVWPKLCRVIGKEGRTAKAIRAISLHRFYFDQQGVEGLADIAHGGFCEAVNRAFETTLAEGVRFERRVFQSLFATHPPLPERIKVF